MGGEESTMRASAGVTLWLAALLVVTGGCQGPSQPKYAACAASLPRWDDPAATLEAYSGHVSCLAPTAPIRTVLNPDAPQRPISLTECIALALENGRNQTGNIRVFAFDPAIAATDIENSLAKFDAQFVTSMEWRKVDEPVAGPLQSATSPFSKTLNQDVGLFSSGLIKPLPTGGVAGITFNTNYLLTTQSTTDNPDYQTILRFTFEQPLLRGSGVAINQLLNFVPSPVTLPLANETTAPGILLTRVAFDKSKDQFELQLQALLLNVEQAYWNLYLRYWFLYTQEIVMRQSLLAWDQARKRFEAGEMSIQDLSQLEGQYQTFRRQRLAALGGSAPGPSGVLEAEAELRLTIGLPAEDGTRLVPCDVPTQAIFVPDWDSALATARHSRPDLRAIQEDVKLAQLALIRARNAYLPDLRFYSNYNLNGAGTQLDGQFSNALRSLASDRFNDWTIGLRLYVPIGFRAVSAQGRQAELQLQQQLASLHDLENQAIFALQRSYRTLPELTELIRIDRAVLQAAVTQLRARFEEFRNGQGYVLNLVFAQQTWAGALSQYQTDLVAYNIALADFQGQQGTLLAYDNVTIAEGPLPPWAQARASDHIRESKAALVLRERAAPAVPSTDALLRPPDPVSIPAVLDEVLRPALPERLPQSGP
jgi:outer membrane protein TolC